MVHRPPGSPFSSPFALPALRFPFPLFQQASTKWISRAPCRIKQQSYAELCQEDSPALPAQTSCAVPCRATGISLPVGRVGARQALPAALGEEGKVERSWAKVASSGRSRNNSCEQEVISRGERF